MAVALFPSRHSLQSSRSIQGAPIANGNAGENAPNGPAPKVPGRIADGQRAVKNVVQ